MTAPSDGRTTAAVSGRSETTGANSYGNLVATPGTFFPITVAWTDSRTPPRTISHFKFVCGSDFLCDVSETDVVPGTVVETTGTGLIFPCDTAVGP